MTAVSYTRIISKVLRIPILLLVMSCSVNVDDREGQVTEVSPSGRGLSFADREFDIPVFVYHRFADSRYPTTNIDTSLFREHLQAIKDAGFRSVSFSELKDLIATNDRLNRLCMITIDDGYKSVLRGVRILKEFEFGATVFVNTSTVGSGDYMNWEDLKSIQEQGIDIGNHTHSHPFLLDSTDRVAALKTELEVSQDIFKNRLGVAPLVFAYPYGEFHQLMFQVLISNGFEMSFAQNSGVFNESSNIQAVPRFPMNDLYGKLDRFNEKLKMKGLRIQYNSDSVNEFVANPPDITLEVRSEVLDDQIQFFVSGRVEEIKKQDGGITLKSSRRLDQRRSLYTLTTKDRNNQWYWYSHPWFNPAIPDQ